MPPRSPIHNLATHDVTNMPPPIGDQDLWAADIALREGVERHGGGWGTARLAALGQLAGREEIFEKADEANRNPPALAAYDRFGQRLNSVKFHPAYHELMQLALTHELPNFAWRHPQTGSQVIHAAQTYLFGQAEGGVLCPMAMSYAAIPALKATPEIYEEWAPRLLQPNYDPRDIPVAEKTGITMGMFMTEKQGGSDVRLNSTRATPLGAATGEGADYELTGHKFFCSAPMSDAFLLLAQAPGGLSCFLVPRWRPDGTRNSLNLTRLKEKLGNRSNATAEAELDHCFGRMLGPEGRGIRTIIDMIEGNRLYCLAGSAAIMRQALVQALHHTRHRIAFGDHLINQPLMQAVLADIAIESEAALSLTLRIAAAFDALDDEAEAALARIGTAIGKYWICKRTPILTAEALECLGGGGYMEESLMPRLYREAPVNSVWEGAGNIMCLDVLRAMMKEPTTIPALMAEFEKAQGGHKNLDAAIARLQDMLSDQENLPALARRLTEHLALIWQAALLQQHAPPELADAFCESRLGDCWTGAFGALPRGLELAGIIQRAAP